MRPGGGSVTQEGKVRQCGGGWWWGAGGVGTKGSIVYEEWQATKQVWQMAAVSCCRLPNNVSEAAGVKGGAGARL